MSSTTVEGRALAQRSPRVRERARDSLALMAFSAGASAIIALTLTALTMLGR